MPVVVITPPDPLVNVATARARLGLDSSVDDATITALVQAACDGIDGPTGWLARSIGEQTLELRLSRFPEAHYRHHGHWFHDGLHASRHPHKIELPYPDVISVTSVSYVDQDGEDQVIDGEQYVLDGRFLVPAFAACWPNARYQAASVRIRYQAGYSTVPEAIKQAVLLSVSQMRSMVSRDPSLTTDTVYGVGSQSFGSSMASGFTAAVQALLLPYRVIQ